MTAVLRFATPLVAVLLTVTLARAQATYTPLSFTTLAGTPFVLGSVDATGAAAKFNAPSQVAVDSSGNIYVADQGNSTIRKITPGGSVSTLAGLAGVQGSADGTGSAARFNSPVGIAVDASGTIFVADASNSTIRKVTAGGVVTTVAGKVGVTGGLDGTGTAATFNGPVGIAVDGSDNLYVADKINNTIRKITSAGVVTTFAGTLAVAGSTDATGTVARFNNPEGVAVDGGGNVYVADTNNSTIRKITSAGVTTTLAGGVKNIGFADGQGTAATFTFPTGVSVDGSGNVYVADQDNDTIRKITSGGAVTTFAGVGRDAGFADGTGPSAMFDAPYGVAVDSGGNVYVADQGNETIRKITSSASTTTLAGTPGGGFADGTGAAAGFDTPALAAVDPSGNLYVADEFGQTIRKITPSGTVSTIAGHPGLIGSSDGTGSGALFKFPYGVAADGSGNVYVADTGNNTVRKIAAGGVVTTLAGSAGVAGYVDATGSAARFSVPIGVAVDGSGNVFVTEQGNYTVRKITPAGVVTTVAGSAGGVGSSDGTGTAAKFNLPAGIVVDGNDNLYVCDLANDTIRKITAGGVVSTLAGSVQNAGSKDGTGTAAKFFVPDGIAIDSSGNLFVADQLNDTIRKITPAGVVTTVAGTPTIFGSTDGNGAAALFNSPIGVAVDSSGTVYVSDSGNDTIRKSGVSGAPSIQTQPSSQFVAVGANVTLSVVATGGSALSYQWNLNGAAIAGANSSTYSITNAQSTDSGAYTVTVTDALGSLTSSAANVNVTSGSTGARLINISTLAQVGTGSNILIPGFVIGGSGTETLLIRGGGPSLAQFSVTGFLTQPTISVFSGQTQIATNTGWTTNASPALITSTAALVGAYAYAPGSADSALIVTLSAGAYTVKLSGVNNTTGTGIAEVYEVASTGSARLINIATLAQVGHAPNFLVPGFVISGSGSEQLLCRGDGPSLAQFSVTGVLAQPVLNVIAQSGTVIATNTGWTTSADAALIPGVEQEVGAFPFAAGSADSAAIVTLSAGAYTMQISGASGSTGTGLAEVYEVP